MIEYDGRDEPFEGLLRLYQPTSRLAWEAMIPVNAELDREIMGALELAGARGLICQDIEAMIGRSHQSVSGNLRHLVEKGLVEFAGIYGHTESGRKAMQWRIASVKADV